MNIIDSKYTKKWSPRRAILLAVVQSMFTGFFLSAALFESHFRVIHVGMALAAGFWALLATLVALNGCLATTKGQ